MLSSVFAFYLWHSSDPQFLMSATDVCTKMSATDVCTMMSATDVCTMMSSLQVIDVIYSKINQLIKTNTSNILCTCMCR